jgi:aryl-alcohol dehydrogenase-like predicted oxidoreductase
MNYRKFGRTGWQVGNIGYGMWGMGAWSGSEDSESMESLQRAIDLGCNFFDTAWVYGDGHSEKLLGRLLKANAAKKIFVATKVPPKNMTWPAPDQSPLDENYPPEHVTEFVERSLQNLGLDAMDLIQFHTWNDAWLENPRTAEVIEKLQASGKVRAVGISLNRWQPWNGVKAVRAGLVHAVQVVYNIFDQNPEDELFAACRENNVAVIARVPFDEGSLTGMLNAETKWPEGDFRNRYFGGGNLVKTLARVEALKPLLHDGMTLAEPSLRFILSNPDIATAIPGMRKIRNVEANVAASDKGVLSAELLGELRKHCWNRKFNDPS